MANATRVEEVVEVVQPAKVVLELSPAEAKVIFDLTGKVGGQPASTRRGLTQEVHNALNEALDRPAIDVSDMKANASGIGVYFTERP